MASLCDDCRASGLPILPVRYAVVPSTIAQGLPGWVSGDRVASVPLHAEFKYALRTMRAGYIYLFYSKNQDGPNVWECYVATVDGQLSRQPDALMAANQPAVKIACGYQGHNRSRLNHLVIERPDKCGPTWIAFSAHKWSEETLNEYTANSKLRNARMQTIHPAEMAKGAKHSHGTPASVAALEQVIEYAAGSPESTLPYDAAVNTFSGEDGHYEAAFLPKVSTLYPWHLRRGQADADFQAMQLRAKKADGSFNTPHVLALWDAIGITHELNGFRNDAAGWLDQYRRERELQITAANAIGGIKAALDKRIVETWDHIAANTNNAPDFQEDGMRNQASRRYAKADPSDLAAPLYKLDQKFKAGNLDEASYKAQRSQLFAQHSRDPQAMEAEYAKIDQYRRELAQTRGTNLARLKQDGVARSWSRYKDHLNDRALAAFEQSWSHLLTAGDTLVDQRTQVLIRWLETPLFIDTLEDFHPACDADGVRFEDVVGDAVFGMGSCASGAAKIDEWVGQAKASLKTNLIWRTVALNQQEGMVEVDAALQVAFGAQVPLSTQAWEKVGSQVKWNKVADLAKKSLTAYNTQAKAINDATSGIQGVGSMRGLDKIFATVGGQWVRPFKWAVDTVNEVTLRTLLMVRSGAEPLATKALGAWDAANNAADRDMLVRRLRNQDVYLSAAAKAQYEEHAKKWAALRANVEVPDAKRQSFNAARDARLALVVAVFEAFNLYKASAKAAQQPGSEKVQAQLTAAKLATASAAIDVLSNMVKGLAAAGDRAVSYQALKFGGGALSVVASGYGAALDFGESSRVRAGGDYRMATFYFIRGTFQYTSAVLTALTALSYCSPLIETFGKRYGQRLAGQVLNWAAKRLLLARAALVFASLEVSIFLLAVSAIIWYFEDDELQKWCDRCAFGSKRKTLSDSYGNADTQLQKFEDALKEAV